MDTALEIKTHDGPQLALLPYQHQPDTHTHTHQRVHSCDSSNQDQSPFLISRA